MNGVAIVASGGANVASLQFALQRLGRASEVTADSARIRDASHVILPGVGAAADAMQRLRQLKLDAVLPSLTQPVLGVCLGMQLLFESSEEGDTTCLGIIRGRAEKIPSAAGRPVPHMGWNTLSLRQPHPLLNGLDQGGYAYFVHSYAVTVGVATLASCEYGTDFSACVARRNFFGTQFHPERSASLGARILGNFLGLN